MKYLIWLIVFGGLFLRTLSAQGQPLPISLPSNATGQNGQSVTIPIQVGNTTGAQILAFQAIVSFDPAVLQATGASSAGTLSEILGDLVVLTEEDRISVGVLGNSSLSGSGTLVNLEFNIVGQPGQSTDLLFDFFLFNTGIPGSILTDGHFTVVAAPQPQIRVEPISHDFGTVFVQSSLNQDFTITNDGDTTLSVTNIQISGQHAAEFSLSGVSLPITLDAGSSRTITAQFAPVTPGTKSAAIEITSNDPDNPVVTVPLTGEAQARPAPDLTIIPDSIAFGEIVVNTTSDGKQVVLRNTGTAPLQVTSVQLVDADAAEFVIEPAMLSITLAPHDSASIEIRFKPVSTGMKSARLRVSSDDPDEPEMFVALSGIAVPQPGGTIMTSQDSVTFGKVAVDSTSEQTIRVSNVGPTVLTLTNLALAGSGAVQFRIVTQGTPFFIQPQSFTDLAVAFEPKVPGEFTASLQIDSSDPENPTLNLPLLGEAIGALSVQTSIFSPADSSFVCGDSVLVQVQTTTQNGVPPLEMTCVINGVVVSDASNPLAVMWPVVAGENPVFAQCTVTDSLGRLVSSSDSIVVFAPARPECHLAIISPSANEVITEDSINVVIRLVETAGAPPFSESVEVNGRAAVKQDSLFFATLACVPGIFKITASSTVTDSCGRVATCTDSIQVLCGGEMTRFLIGVDEDNRTLITVDLQAETPAVRVIGKVLLNDNSIPEMESMAVDEGNRRVFVHANDDDGLLLTFGYDSIPVPPDTGSIRATLIGVTGFEHLDGLAFDQTSGRLLGVETKKNELLAINPATVEVTRIGALGFDNVEGLTFGGADETVLYGIDNDSHKLIVIDTATGKGEAVSDVRIPFDNIETLVWDKESGSLFGFSDSEPREFIVIDISDGNATELTVAGIDDKDIEGLGYVTVTGKSTEIPSSPEAEELPERFRLYQNYPNPFNPTTTISFDIPGNAAGEQVQLHVFNIAGQRVATLVDDVRQPGQHQVVWDARDSTGRALASGFYIYQLRVAGQAKAMRMLLLK